MDHKKAPKTNKLLLAALLIGIVFHGTSIFFTLEQTYDALVHLFFANHYATSWFEPWNYSWYTGFTVMGYPPLVHQLIALFSFVGGLKFGLYLMAMVGVVLFTTGVYRMALMISNHRQIAGYSALLAVLSSSFVETLHLFGQLPSIIGISLLMHALPEIYLWVLNGKRKRLIHAFALLAVTVCSHHVTPIFGMVFFIFPVIGLALMDYSKAIAGSYKAIRLTHFFKSFKSSFGRIVLFGTGALALIILCILPYWINTKNNPITQVPIPHGSRDSFIEVGSSGLVFFIIPWGILLLLWPYLFAKYFSKRYLFFGISFALLTLLGTGGTTPIPKFLLGENAFSILTLDRFTLWATIMALPIAGAFAFELFEGSIKTKIESTLGSIYYKLLAGGFIALFIGIALATVNLGNFRPAQPKAIDMQPIVNFLNQDEHYKWRFLPLGFGDQMALLSAQTKALTVDGNYHSARRIPELTSRAVERLENSKFRGVEGLGSLQQFLTSPEKYHLKYVFSNDKFYDPVLFFTGWTRLPTLENGIAVWERAGVSPLPTILPKDTTSLTLKLWWGIVPMSTVLFLLLFNLKGIWKGAFYPGDKKIWLSFKQEEKENHISSKLSWTQKIWATCCLGLLALGAINLYLTNASQISPQNVVMAYYDAIDFKSFEKAYSLVDPLDYSKDQFMLEIAVSDGLLSSYAKLDAIELETMSIGDSTAVIRATTQWITPLKAHSYAKEHRLIKKSQKWYLIPDEKSNDIPPDQLIARNTTVFYNQGRRALTTKNVFYQDDLKQPRVAITQSALIQQDGLYSIIGELINLDNQPADVSIEGILYDADNNAIAKYNVKDVIKHQLLAKERTSFSLAFEAISWLNNDQSVAGTFDPEEFNPLIINQKPARYSLEVSSNVATQDIYNAVVINTLENSKYGLSGNLFNSGTRSVIIPQVLVSYYDTNKELLWVESIYLNENIRPQRDLAFSFLPREKLPERKNATQASWSVNGLANEQMWDSLDTIVDDLANASELIPITNKDYAFIGLKVNSYTGHIKGQ